ncbi:hypothetical protein HZS_2835 [Henneguya salminicola]|nr:hypothetical protein HZS_2835 [Henneguya salminicola]
MGFIQVKSIQLSKLKYHQSNILIKIIATIDRVVSYENSVCTKITENRDENKSDRFESLTTIDG